MGKLCRGGWEALRWLDLDFVMKQKRMELGEDLASEVITRRNGEGTRGRVPSSG